MEDVTFSILSFIFLFNNYITQKNRQAKNRISRFQSVTNTVLHTYYIYNNAIYLYVPD